MALADFLSFTLPTHVGCSLFDDNAPSHFSFSPSSPAPKSRKVKLCRWDSSLSKRESMALRLDSPKRSIERANATIELEERKEHEMPPLILSPRSVIPDYSKADKAFHRPSSWTERNVNSQELPQDNDNQENDAPVQNGPPSTKRSLQFEFDMNWAGQSISDSSTRSSSSDPPRMPHRNQDYFPEGEEREQ